MKTHVVAGLLCALELSCVVDCQADGSSVIESLPSVVKSLPVQIVPSLEHSVLAWTTVSMMESHVSYNPRIAKKLPKEVLAFALVHEYGHLRLKHVSAMNFENKSPTQIKQQELEADRFAAKFWATNNTKVAQAAAAAFVSPSGQRALGSEKPSLEKGYPTRKERAQAILDCLGEIGQSSAPKNP